MDMRPKLNSFNGKRIRKSRPHYGYYYFKPYMAMLAVFIISGSSLMFIGQFSELPLIPAAGLFLIIYGIVSTIGWLLARYVIPGNRIDFARKVIRSMDLKGSENVLDIGSGRGIYAIEAAKALTTGRVTGIDVWNPSELEDLRFHHRLSQPTGNTIANARQNAMIEGVGQKVTFINMDANHLKFEDNEFDLVICGFVIGHLWKLGPGILKEIRRVLKPGGRLVLVDSFRDLTYLLLSTPHLFLFSYLKGRKARVFTRENWFSLITGTGFRIGKHQAGKSIMVVECIR